MSIFPPASWLVRTRPRCLTETISKSQRIRPDPPSSCRPNEFLRTICAPMHAKCASVRTNPTASDRIQMDFANLLFLSNAALHTDRIHAKFQLSLKAPDTSRSKGCVLQCVAIIRAVVRFEKLLKRTICVGISHGIPNKSRLTAQIGTKAY